MRVIFLFIFFVMSLVADCDISKVITIEHNGGDINTPIVSQNTKNHYKIKSTKIEANKQVAISITAQFNTLVSVSFASATMAKFSFQISNSKQNSHLICNNSYLIDGYEYQDIRLKSGQNLLIIFGVADIGADKYEFESNIVFERVLLNSNQNIDIGFGDIYTQIIGREFDIEFYSNEMISDLEIRLNNGYEIYRSSNFDGGKIKAIIPNLANLNYKNLYFLARFKDQKGVLREVKSQNFNARVAEFKLEKVLQNPKGGVKYKDFRLLALDYSGARIIGYNASFSGDFIKHTLSSCLANMADETIEFSGGVGEIRTDQDGFVYPDMGVARLEFADFDNSDKGRDACLINSFTNEPNKDGKIGCYTKIAQDIGYFDYDKIAHIKSDFHSKFGLFGVVEVNITQAQYDDFMGVEAGLEFEAKLFDNSTAKLFSANCYANSVSFSNYSKLIMSAPNEPKDQNGIYQSGINIYIISKNSFKNGVGKGLVKLSLPRDRAQNPYKITPNDIDTNLTIKSNLDQNKNYSYLYYAKAYGQKLTQATSYPHMANIYFAIYCDNECQNIARNSGEYSPILDNNMSVIPELKEHFIFKDFNASSKIVELKSSLNSPSDVIGGVMDVQVNNEQKIEFEIKNTHFYGSDFILVRLFRDTPWVGVGDYGEVMGIQKGQKIRYNRAIEW
ncbi:hypothetical protein V2I29_07120 [Campylobacter sp. CX2-8023-23]|uniref:hypothetical protein n=1 Tax=Campylobacter porcelli TaxID=1660073 RepID=UPI002ECBE4E7|nr:hypothetical protein [Campylobacter sp. CX2-8023-23]